MLRIYLEMGDDLFAKETDFMRFGLRLFKPEVKPSDTATLPIFYDLYTVYWCANGMVSQEIIRQVGVFAE